MCQFCPFEDFHINFVPAPLEMSRNLVVMESIIRQCANNKNNNSMLIFNYEADFG